jgi:hydroxymethylbilane synthase
VDLAVHSAKDMPAELPEALDVAAVLPREDPRDAVVLHAGKIAADFAAALAQVGETPTIATSSIRRVAQLQAILPRARFAPIRGNVDTRLRKLDDGGFDAIVLASAGMRRLGFANRISAAIPLDICIPAPGQGIVAIEIRADDARTRAALQSAGDGPAAVSLLAERTVVNTLGGGCQLPLGAIAVHDGGGLRMHGVVATPDGRRAIRCSVEGPVGDPAGLGERLAEELARGGATDILDAVRAANSGSSVRVQADLKK